MNMVMAIPWVIGLLVENKKVIGITGLYTMPEDEKEANWVAWFCVEPDYRGKGLGSRLLDLMIEKSKKAGKKFLRLYTSDGEIEKEARELYKKSGFVTTKTKKIEGENETKIYMELKLNSGNE